MANVQVEELGGENGRLVCSSDRVAYGYLVLLVGYEPLKVASDGAFFVSRIGHR